MRKPLKTLLICSLIIFGGIVILAITLPICIKCGKWHVVHNYYSAIGLEGSLKYENVVEKLGEPDEIRRETRESGFRQVVLDYTKFALFYSMPDDPDAVVGSFFQMEIYDPECRLRSDIHVESTRAQIIRAYRGVTQIPQSLPGTAYGDYKVILWLYDNPGSAYTRGVYFEYDDHDIVTKITYAPFWQ